MWIWPRWRERGDQRQRGAGGIRGGPELEEWRTGLGWRRRRNELGRGEG